MVHRRNGPETRRPNRSGQPDLTHICADYGWWCGLEQRRVDRLQNGACGRAQAAKHHVPDQHRLQPQDARRHVTHTHHMPSVVHHYQLHV